MAAREIDDAQPTMRERDTRPHVESRVVWPSVGKHVAHANDPIPVEHATAR
jgi:hypothetical protein